MVLRGLSLCSPLIVIVFHSYQLFLDMSGGVDHDQCLFIICSDLELVTLELSNSGEILEFAYEALVH